MRPDRSVENVFAGAAEIPAQMAERAPENAERPGVKGGMHNGKR